MKNKKLIVPVLALALLVSAGVTSVALANNGMREMPEAVLATFTSSEQAAIQEAEAIRIEAHTRAQAVLSAAGVTEEELHNAFKGAMKEHRAEVASAIEANDYNAFVAATAGGPRAETITQEAFAKIVEAHKLFKSGDKEGAMEIRKELNVGGKFLGGERGFRSN